MYPFPKKTHSVGLNMADFSGGLPKEPVLLLNIRWTLDTRTFASKVEKPICCCLKTRLLSLTDLHRIIHFVILKIQNLGSGDLFEVFNGPADVAAGVVRS